MKAKIALALLLVLAVAGALAGIKVAQIRKMIAGAKAMTLPPETVSSVVAREEEWQATLNAIGSVAAVRGVTVTADIPGTIREIAFESGTLVEKDAVLVKLDVSAETAQLNAVEAQVALARVNLERVRALRKENMVSQSELDTAEATLKQHEASAEAIQATIAKKVIRAPFAGRLGIRQVDLGQYIDSGKPIVQLQALDPVYADFSLPQQEIPKLTNGMVVRLTTDAYTNRAFVGKLTAINPGLDQATRSVGLQATLDNPDHALRPGMFARVEVLLPQVRKQLVIPATAVLSAPYGDSVFIIEPGTNSNLVVRQQLIRTGPTRGDFISVESGLKPGEKIAGSGVFKLRPGMSVVENNELVPKASETPRPADA